MTITSTPVDIKEVKTKLLTKKDERLQLILSLGEKIYQRSLKGDASQLQVQSEVASILQCDKEIYTYASIVARESKALEVCPNCQKTNASNIKFCGNCGTLNPLFLEQQTEKAICGTCGESIPAEYEFCPCCGVKQGDA